MKAAIVAGALAWMAAAQQPPAADPEARRTAAEALFQRGSEALSKGRFAEAEEAFTKLRAAEPLSARGVMGLSETYLAENKPEQAMSILLQEERAHPRDLNLQVAVGNLAVRTGNFDMALDRYLGVLKAVEPGSPSEAELQLRIGETYRRKGDNAEAIRYLTKARQAMPDNPAAAMPLALTLDTAGRKGEAMAAYEAVIRANPKNAIALNNQAFLLADTAGDLDTALAYAKRAQEILPELDDISDTLGWIYLKKGDAAAAEPIFRKLAQKDPARAGYHYHLAMALESKGDKSGAIAELEAAAKNKPSPTEEAEISEALKRLNRQ